MKLSELKTNILNNTLNNSLLIFVWTDTNFLAKQYVHEIAKVRGQDIQFVDNYLELVGISTNENVFGEEFGEGVLKVLSVDTFDELANDKLSSLENSIVICNKIAKEVEHSYENYPNLIVKFPKPESWQVKEYIKANCKGLSKESIETLYSITNGDIFRIDSELGKISCFPIDKQDELFRKMMSSGAYSDLTQMNIFNLVNAIIRRDMTTIGDALRNIKSIDVDAIGLTTILHNNIKNIIDIQMNSKATPEAIGISEKQFNVIKKYNCGRFSDNKLRELLLFLDEIDFKLKSGGLDISNDDKIDYIVCKMLER